MFYNRFVTIFYFLLFLGFIFYSHSAIAVTDRCPRHVVKTELKSKEDKTRFLSGSLTGINDYLNSHGVLAFVENPISVKTYYKFGTKDLGNGKYCVILEAVKAYYRSSPSIVMPSNLSKKSCEYKIIREHEQRHLDVHYKYYDKSVKKYQVFLGRIARQVPIFRPVTTEKEADYVRSQIMNYFDERFYERVGKSIEEMRALQKKIDSKQEYTFTNRKIQRCSRLEAEKKRPNRKSFYDY